jgi:chloramphenicol 3-O phosphotransferase
MPDIILLSGSSSVGKTSVARAIQQTSNLPYVLIGIDMFIESLPQQYWDRATSVQEIRSDELAKLGFHYAKPGEDGNNYDCPDVRFGTVAQRVMDGMHQCIGLLAELGNKVIVDHVFLEEQWYHDLMNCLKGRDVLKVKLFCAKEELEKREKARGDRMIGTAWTWQNKVHWDINYDLEIDTTKMPSEEIAALVLKQSKN